jgi:hypothetical protein
VFGAFYGTFSTIAFTIFGLWMFVAQARFREWMENRDQYRRASAVSIQFALPGLMALIALIDPESASLWRAAFGITSVVAVVLLVALQRRPGGTPAGANEVSNWIAVALFACIAVIAVAPRLASDMGVGGPTRRLEVFFFCMLLLNGLVVAWMMLFAETVPARELPTA